MPVREQPLWLRILLNICGPFGTGLALFGYLNAGLGLAFLGGTVLYVGWELYPDASVFVRRRKLASLFVFLCTGLLVGLCAWVLILKMPHVAPLTPQNDISETRAELKEANDFICIKDENDLRAEFDFPEMLKYNIEFAKRNLAPNMVSADSSAAIDSFFLNGNARLDLRYAKVTVVNNRVNVEWIPGKIGVINTSKKYGDNRKTLSRLMSSAALPAEVTAALKMVDDAIEKNSVLMIESLNESLAADPRNILENNLYGTEHYGSASGLYWHKFIPLRPRADMVTLAVRKAMESGISGAPPVK